MNKEQLIEKLQNQTLVSTNEIRQKAFEFINSNHFPTQKDEVWKHTNLSAVLKHDYELAAESDSKITNQVVNAFLFPEIKQNVIVFYNGFLNQEACKIHHNKIIIESLRNENDIKTKYFNLTDIASKNIFSSINTAFSGDGVLIYVPKNTIVEEPIQLINLYNSNGTNVFTQTRVLLVIDENSEIKLIENHNTIVKYNANPNNQVLQAQATSNCFSNYCIEVILLKNSKIEYTRIQHSNEKSNQINTTCAIQEQNSYLNFYNFILDGNIVRNELYISLNGENAETNLNGLNLATGDKLFDNYVYINHAKSNCQSKQLYKGIIDHKAASVFLGRVHVARDSQKTDAQQSNKNILLTNDAKAYSKPQLEIYADDVKCSHGSSTGQIDQNQLFYMQSRGISKEEARKLLLHAFAGEVVNAIKYEPLKEHMTNTLNEILGK